MKRSPRYNFFKGGCNGATAGAFAFKHRIARVYPERRQVTIGKDGHRCSVSDFDGVGIVNEANGDGIVAHIVCAWIGKLIVCSRNCRIQGICQEADGKLTVIIDIAKLIFNLNQAKHIGLDFSQGSHELVKLAIEFNWIIGTTGSETRRARRQPFILQRSKEVQHIEGCNCDIATNRWSLGRSWVRVDKIYRTGWVNAIDFVTKSARTPAEAYNPSQIGDGIADAQFIVSIPLSRYIAGVRGNLKGNRCGILDGAAIIQHHGVAHAQILVSLEAANAGGVGLGVGFQTAIGMETNVPKPAQGKQVSHGQRLGNGHQHPFVGFQIGNEDTVAVGNGVGDGEGNGGRSDQTAIVAVINNGDRYAGELGFPQKNSLTVPVTRTRSPTLTSTAGLLPSKMNKPSEVASLPSASVSSS